MKKVIVPGIIILLSLIIPVPLANRVVGEEVNVEKALDRARALLAEAGVPPEVLQRDIRLFVDNFPEIERAVQEQGFPREDAPNVAVSFWLYMRYPRKGATQPASVQHIEKAAHADPETQRTTFRSAMNGMGKLTVTSQPTSASVEVSGVPWDDPTNTSRFVDEGEHTIVVKKGDLSDTGKVSVKRRKTTTHQAILK